MTAKAATIAREAERRLEREYEPLKAETLRSLSAKLRGHGIRVPEQDLEEYYNQAWHALYMQASSGTEIANTGGFLVQVGFRRAIDDFRRSRPDERADVPLEEVAPVESDVVQRLEDQRRLREFTEALREELGERERVAASLCYIHGYTRPEAAKLMGLNERRMQKVMDAVSKAIGRITREIDEGDRCENRASLNKAYALGLLDTDGERYAQARSHLDECSRCRAYVLGLRGLASVAPPTMLPWAALGGGGGGGGGGDTATPKPRPRPRVNPATAAVVTTAAVAVAVVAGVLITRGSSDDGRPTAATPTASAPSGDEGAPGSSDSSDSDSSDSSSRPDSQRSDSSSRPRDGDSGSRGSSPGSSDSSPGSGGSPAPEGSSGASPSDSPAAPPAATPVATPVPTAAPPVPEPTATAEPPVRDDGAQEFGFEP